MSNDEFFSFDEALSELRLKEEELKRLVSEGEIRAFREGETMKLRKGDVEALRSDLGGSEVIDLGEPSEEIVFEDDNMADEAGMATEEISDVDTIIEDDIEDVGEIEIEDDDIEEATPLRRSAPRAAGAAQEEEATESMGVLAAVLITTVVMIGSLPLLFSISSGETSGIAKGIASMFFGDSF
ncbi:MAG: hypothetical protein ACI8X5_000555 [Planctomycetota bacterium]